MMAFGNLGPVVIVVLQLMFLTGAMGQQSRLECMQCENVETKDSSGLLSFMQDFKTDAYCGSPDFFHMPATTTCQPGESCSAVSGTVRISIPLIGSKTIKTTVRACAPYAPTGCVSSLDTAKDILNEVLEFEGSIGQFDGSVCFCNTAGCMAGTCGDGYVSIASYCFAWWMILIVAVLLVSLLACCCCCCRCCARKKNPGTILTRPSTGHVILVQNAAPMAIDQPVEYVAGGPTVSLLSPQNQAA